MKCLSYNLQIYYDVLLHTFSCQCLNDVRLFLQELDGENKEILMENVCNCDVTCGVNYVEQFSPLIQCLI
jgi:hypothetical protein